MLTGAGGRPLPQALFEAGRHAPPEVRPAFASAQREWQTSTDFGRALTTLKAELAEASTDVVCETLLVAQQIGGTGVGRRLEALIDDRHRELQLRRGRALPPGGRSVRAPVRARRASGHGPRRPLARNGKGRIPLVGGPGGRHRRSRSHRRLLVVGGTHSADPAPRSGVRVVSRLLLICALVAWAGAALVVADTRWAHRTPLSRRLAIFHGGRPADDEPTPTRRVVEWASVIGGRVTRLLGIDDDLAVRLERVHSDADPSGVRLQQVGWTIAGLAAGIALAALASPPPGLGVVVVLGPAALGFLLVEHRITAASDRWKHRVADELPVVTEQLAMLLGAGYAVGPAVARIAERGQGACAIDFVASPPGRRKA